MSTTNSHKQSTGTAGTTGHPGSALNEYFKTSVDQYRASVLMQGGHSAGKSTVLNALLGYHIFPYFKSPSSRPDIPATTSRFSAGVGATAVAMLNIGSVHHQPQQEQGEGGGAEEMIGAADLDPNRPVIGSISHAIVPNSLVQHPAVMPHFGSSSTASTIIREDSSVHFHQDGLGSASPGGSDASSAAFSPMNNITASSTARQQGGGGEEEDSSQQWVVLERPVQSFYYDAVEAIEDKWRSWIATLPPQATSALPPTTGTTATGTKAAGDQEERMLFVVRINQSEEDAVENVTEKRFVTDRLPFLNCVESTELADRPPMTFVHSAVVVLSDATDHPEAQDTEGARRMYVQSALYCRTNTHSILVYNLFNDSADSKTDEEIAQLRSTLCHKWNVEEENVFIFNARKALADALLAHNAIPAQFHRDTAELQRLRARVIRNHVEAHDRFLQRLRAAQAKKVQQQQEEGQQAVRSLSTTQPVATKNTTASPGEDTTSSAPQTFSVTLTARYIPRSFTAEYQREDRAVAAMSAQPHTADPHPHPQQQQPTATHTYIPTVSKPAAVEEEKQLAQHLERCGSETVVRVQSAHAIGETESAEAERARQQYVPQFARNSSEQIAEECAKEKQGYKPKVVPSDRTSPKPVEQPHYVPKCVAEESVAHHTALSAVQGQQDYVPKCVGESSPSLTPSIRHRIVLEGGSTTSTSMSSSANSDAAQTAPGDPRVSEADSVPPPPSSSAAGMETTTTVAAAVGMGQREGQDEKELSRHSSSSSFDLV